MAEEAKLSLHLGSDPTLAVLRVGGEELTAAKRRALRFQSADEFLRALDAAALTPVIPQEGLDLELAPAVPEVDLELDATVVVQPIPR